MTQHTNPNIHAAGAGSHAAAIAAIDLQITPLREKIAAQEGRALALAYPASTGDRDAADEIARIRTRKLGLEDQLHTLQQGRAVAEGSLHAEQSGEAAAEAEAGRAAARSLVLQRIEAAAKFDAAASALQAAYVAFTEIGKQAANHPFSTIGVMGGMAIWENVAGTSRVLAAMPAMMKALYPQALHHAARTSLVQTEAALWGITTTPSAKPI